MVKLKTPLKFNEKITKVRLPERNSQSKEIVSTAGWGDMAPDLKSEPKPAKILPTVDLKLIDDRECELAIDKKLNDLLMSEILSEKDLRVKNQLKEELEIQLKNKFILHETSICASGPFLGGKGTCMVSTILKLFSNFY